MKKTLALVAMCFSLYQVQAQTNFNNQKRVTVEPGVRAGLNLSNFTNWRGTEVRPDFYVGGMVSINLFKFYTLQPEINYSRQGAKYDFQAVGNFPELGNPQEDLEVQYLSFGLMNKFNIAQGFHVIVGPSVDFKVGDNFSNQWWGGDVADIDFALHGGIGYTLDMGLTVEARYKMGLVDIFGYEDWADDDYNGNYDDIILNSVIQLGLNYSF